MTGIRYDIETIMEVIEQVYDDDHELTITFYGTCWIKDMAGKCQVEFVSYKNLYNWTAKQQAKLDEQQKTLNKQQAKDHRDSDPFLHLW